MRQTLRVKMEWTVFDRAVQLGSCTSLRSPHVCHAEWKVQLGQHYVGYAGCGTGEELPA